MRGTQLGSGAFISREGLGGATVLEVGDGCDMVEVDTKLGCPTSFVLKIARSVGMTSGLVVRLRLWFGVGFIPTEAGTTLVRSWDTEGSPVG